MRAIESPATPRALLQHLPMLLFVLFAWGCDGASEGAANTQNTGYEDALSTGSENALNEGSEDAMSWDNLDESDTQREDESDAEGALLQEDIGPNEEGSTDVPLPTSSCADELPYASEVISFAPGINAGYGQKDMPGVVLGPPTPGSPMSGSLDVLTLGVGGEIVLGFGERRIVNGPGPDLVIWENPFWLGGDPDTPFAELGEVAVSKDGETWHAFPCDTGVEEGFDPGCAGWRARGDFEPCTLLPIDPELSGGDPFDLESLGLEEARFVRIRDLATEGAPPSAGFDLDAVGAIYLEAIE